MMASVIGEPTKASAASVLFRVGLLAGVTVGLARILVNVRHRSQNKRHTERCRDEALKQTFPASDPPASQFFDIPENRRADVDPS